MIRFYSWISNTSFHISFIINSIQNSSKKNSKNLKKRYFTLLKKFTLLLRNSSCPTLWLGYFEKEDNKNKRN